MEGWGNGLTCNWTVWHRSNAYWEDWGMGWLGRVRTVSNRERKKKQKMLLRRKNTISKVTVKTIFFFLLDCSNLLKTFNQTWPTTLQYAFELGIGCIDPLKVFHPQLETWRRWRKSATDARKSASKQCCGWKGHVTSRQALRKLWAAKASLPSSPRQLWQMKREA